MLSSRPVLVSPAWYSAAQAGADFTPCRNPAVEAQAIDRVVRRIIWKYSDNLLSNFPL
jgi:hypothetical protein